MVVNFNAGPLTLDCLDSLKALDWPIDALKVVVVDNGSSDGSGESIRQAHPWVHLIDSQENLGFAGGNNLALRDLGEVDYVALLNNDTTVEPGWLVSLVAALEGDPDAGAACSKLLLDGRYVALTIGTETVSRRRWDGRALGVRLSGIELDGVDGWARAQFVDGWWGDEYDRRGGHPFQWSAGTARMYVPAGRRARLRLSADRDVKATVECGATSVRVEIRREPTWVTVPLSDEPFTVVNNVGNRLLPGGVCADRGYLEADRGQYQAASEVFGWCGASVLLRLRYLADVGLFDDRLFLYYEDFDLSWRGRARGWRYLYVPGSVVHHVHSATTGERSSLAAYYVERNRLLVLAKNAPARLALGEGVRFLLTTASYLRRDLVSPLLRGEKPRLTVPARRFRAFGGYLRLAPAMLSRRRALRRRQLVTDEDLLAWVDSDPAGDAG